MLTSSSSHAGPPRGLLPWWSFFALLFSTALTGSVVTRLAVPLYSPRLDTYRQAVEGGYYWVSPGLSRHSPYLISYMFNMQVSVAAIGELRPELKGCRRNHSGHYHDTPPPTYSKRGVYFQVRFRPYNLYIHPTTIIANHFFRFAYMGRKLGKSIFIVLFKFKVITSSFHHKGDLYYTLLFTEYCAFHI